MSDVIASLRVLLGDTAWQEHSDRQGAGPTRAACAAGAFFEVDPLDRLIGNAMAQALHVFEARGARDYGHVSGFALAVLSRLEGEGTIVWITQSLAGLEGGRLHGAGIAEMGLSPSRLLYVDVKRPADVLWAMEESLGSRAVSAVVGEVFDEGAVDLTATRRIALRSERAGIPAYITLARADAAPANAARTRWVVGPAPSRLTHHPGLLGLPQWSVAITKNRAGACADCAVGYAPQMRRFFTPSDASAPAAAPPLADAPAVSRAHAMMRPAVVRLAAERRRAAQAAQERS